jgi:glycerol-3-phosphate dehydrogenase
MVPWGRVTYIGTTDTDYEGPLDEPTCMPDDVAYLLRAANNALTEEIAPSDVVGAWAGLRPLVRDESNARTVDLSRRHRVTASGSGLITVAGGKLTTYREMAADAVDEAVRVLQDQGVVSAVDRSTRHSSTRRLPLRGAAGYEVDGTADGHGDAGGGATPDHLGGRYGSEAATVEAMVDHDPGLGGPLVPGLPYLRAEAVYAARYEMARTLDDVLSRRTRARLFARDASVAAAPHVAALIGPELGWDEAEQAAQVDAYREAVTRERLAAGLPETALEPSLGA